jgi:hypothetical protein
VAAVEEHHQLRMLLLAYQVVAVVLEDSFILVLNFYLLEH